MSLSSSSFWHFSSDCSPNTIIVYSFTLTDIPADRVRVDPYVLEFSQWFIQSVELHCYSQSHNLIISSSHNLTISQSPRIRWFSEETGCNSCSKVELCPITLEINQQKTLTSQIVQHVHNFVRQFANLPMCKYSNIQIFKYAEFGAWAICGETSTLQT
jgi:hypothetical protein